MLQFCDHCWVVYIDTRAVVARLLVHTTWVEERVELNKALAKHPGETSGKQLAFIFLPYLTSNCLDNKCDGGRYGEKDRDSFLQKALHKHPETTVALEKAVAQTISRVSDHLIATWPSSPLSRAPAGVRGSTQNGFACWGRLPPGMVAAAALFSPHFYSCSSVTSGKPPCASVSPTVKWRRGYFTLLRSSCVRGRYLWIQSLSARHHH